MASGWGSTRQSSVKHRCPCTAPIGDLWKCVIVEVPMPTMAGVWLAIPFFLVALFYSLVGHAGASAYLGIMALCGTPPSVIKPTALVLNIVVASIASVKFYRARCFSWPLFWPFAATSIPLAFLGGAITLPGRVYKIAVGLVLMLSAVRLIISSDNAAQVRPNRFRPWLGLLLGAGIGFGGSKGLDCLQFACEQSSRNSSPPH